jgi:hypothetical protein
MENVKKKVIDAVDEAATKRKSKKIKKRESMEDDHQLREPPEITQELV